MRDVADSYADDRSSSGNLLPDPAEAASYHGAEETSCTWPSTSTLSTTLVGAALRESVKRWYAALPDGAWPNLTFSNHDQRRHSSRFAGRNDAETEARLRVAAALLLTLRGTPFLYYGEEIGMRQGRLRRGELRDPLGVKTWPLGFLGRDGERTPMQWSAERFAASLPRSPGAGQSGLSGANVAAHSADARASFVLPAADRPPAFLRRPARSEIRSWRRTTRTPSSTSAFGKGTVFVAATLAPGHVIRRGDAPVELDPTSAGGPS
jgi:alpha-glucosidase